MRSTWLQTRLSRFIGRSRVRYLAACVVMISVSAAALYLAATGQNEVGRYAWAGWVAGPAGIVLFGLCFAYGLKAETDARGRLMKADGTPLGED